MPLVEATRKLKLNEDIVKRRLFDFGTLYKKIEKEEVLKLKTIAPRFFPEDYGKEKESSRNNIKKELQEVIYQ